MPNASAPFKAKTPFTSRVLGLDYAAFGLDFINPPFPNSFGCLYVSPTVDFNVSGPFGGPFVPPSNIYTVTNTGATTMTWTLVASEVWASPDVTYGTLLPGETQNIAITIDANGLLESPTPYTATLTFTNTTNGCGDIVTNISLTVTGDATLVVEGRTKGGTATICGYSEYTTPSTPPKKYLVRTLGGAADAYFYPIAGCAGAPNCTVLDTYSGTCTYDPATCTESNTGGQVVRTNPVAACGGPLAPSTTPTCTVQGQYSPLFGDVIVLTTTTKTVTCPGFPCYNSGGQSAGRFAVCNASETLSSEDTEAAAIIRLLAASAYTSWATALVQGDVLSEYEARTTGFSQAYEFAQWRVSLSGLSPVTLYNGSATVYRRLWGTANPWVFVSTAVISGTTDGSGNFAAGPYDLPNARGYEYTVWNAGLTP